MNLDLGDDIKLYLPRYLSEDRLVILKQQLRKFGEGYDTGKYFTDLLKGEPLLYQGDGVYALVGNFPDTTRKNAPVLLLSNTCDMDIRNERLNPCRIMYAPIFNLDKYIQKLREREIPDAQIATHVNDIKNQIVSQIFYLPKTSSLGYDGMVFFDRAMSISLSEGSFSKCIESRFFSLSDYGFYLLLLKLSYHFTRIQEKVDRG